MVLFDRASRAYAASSIFFRSFSGIFSLSKKFETDRVTGGMEIKTTIFIFHFTFSIFIQSLSLSTLCRKILSKPRNYLIHLGQYFSINSHFNVYIYANHVFFVTSLLWVFFRDHASIFCTFWFFFRRLAQKEQHQGFLQRHFSWLELYC